MTNFNCQIAFGRSFAVIIKIKLRRKNRYEYLDNFYRIYGPELDRKHGIKIEV